MRRLTLASFAPLAVLGLAACGGDAPEEEIAVDLPEVPVEVSDAGPDTSVTLNEEQQARYDAVDWQAVSDEYDQNYRTMWDESGSSTSANQSGQSGSSMSANQSGTSGNGVMTMPPRGQMDFAFLDRNDDGKLSVAEYAIWAVGANPTTPAPNDETRPFMTQEQLNEAGQTFFHFDQDGSTYLSESEFQAARNSGRTA